MEITQEQHRQTAQDRINGPVYAAPHLVHDYASSYLTPPEAITLVRRRDDIVHRRVLDLGCGGGRLSIFLRPLGCEYVGVDVSRHMVDHCRRNHPGLRFELGDMRDLSCFADGSFDTVFAVFNLLDAVSHEDRQRVLAEVRRVLAPGGLFAFSSHNRNAAHAATGPRLRWSRNPIGQVRCAVDYLKELTNHHRIKAKQRFEADYALLNDSGHDYALLHYYVTREAQARQLQKAGFRLLECLDEQGRTLSPGEDDSANSSLHYNARRAQ